MSTTPQLVVFDSGVGALSIVDELLALQCGATINVVADSAYFPYGNKPPELINERIHQLVDHTLERLNPSVMILACNTISTLSLDSLRQKYNIPIIGVVPAVKPAAQLTQTKVMGILATEATVNGSYLQGLIDEFASDVEVALLPCNELVELAERKLMGERIKHTAIKALLDDFIDNNKSLDTLVLACTHFPLLREEIAEAYPTIQLIDSGEAIAQRTQYILNENTQQPSKQHQPHNFFVTNEKYLNSNLQSLLTSKGFDIIQTNTMDAECLR